MSHLVKKGQLGPGPKSNSLFLTDTANEFLPNYVSDSKQIKNYVASVPPEIIRKLMVF